MSRLEELQRQRGSNNTATLRKYNNNYSNSIRDRLKNSNNTYNKKSPLNKSVDTYEEYENFDSKKPNKNRIKNGSASRLRNNYTKTRKKDVVKIEKSNNNFNEEYLEEYEENERLKAKKSDFQQTVLFKAGNFILIGLCIYIVFLTFGVFTTTYTYNQKGEVIAEKLTVNDIKKKTEFEKIQNAYRNARNIYEKVLLIDYQIEKEKGDIKSYATKYSKVLDDVESYIVKTQALNTGTEYANIQELLVNWGKNDIAIYLQNKAAYLSTGDEEKGNLSIQNADTAYASFSTITSNIVSIGESLKGVDVTSEKEWSPEKYVNKAVKGK